MQQSWFRMTAAAVVAMTAGCTPPARVVEQTPERASGCFHRIYADGPPGSGMGGVLYTLSTDAGATRMLEVTPEQLRRAGGASALDGARVSVVLVPSRDSTSSRARPSRVQEIRREPSTSGAPC